MAAERRQERAKKSIKKEDLALQTGAGSASVKTEESIQTQEKKYQVKIEDDIEN